MLTECFLITHRSIAEQLTGRLMVQPVPNAPTNTENWGWERGAGVHGAGLYASVPMKEGDGEGEVKRTDLLSAGIHVDGTAANHAAACFD